MVHVHVSYFVTLHLNILTGTNLCIYIISNSSERNTGPETEDIRKNNICIILQYIIQKYREYTDDLDEVNFCSSFCTAF